jgi:uncharacterized 2Fe-2S/4Fe-4S cluster protein (DUF4445 family)
MHIQLSNGEKIDTEEGETVLRVLSRKGIYLVASCGGKGMCGKCRIKLLEGPARIDSAGKLQPHEKDAGMVLACQTYPEGDVLIDVPKESRLVIGDRTEAARSESLPTLLRSAGSGISPLVKHVTLALQPPTLDDTVSDLERLRKVLEEAGLKGMRFSRIFVSEMMENLRAAGWQVKLAYAEGPEALFISPVENTGKFGIAADIGTTTIAVDLVNIQDGKVIDTGSVYNSQIRYGDDVITRIVHATEGSALDELRDAVISDINTIVEKIVERQGIRPEDIESAVISGNTTMLHLFWGLNPAYIREEPYIPAITVFPLWKAGTGRLGINQQAPVYTVPGVASYVGGDIVAGVLASGIHRRSGISLFLDIGTNGEIVIGNSEWLITAACSAGPCFEGSGIRHGMRATEGAIESVIIHPDTLEPETGVIGSGKPSGICGSGMIDAISELFLKGLVDRRGRFEKGLATKRIRQGDEGGEFLFSAPEAGIVLTEVDIENILRAKAAVYAGISVLMKKVGLTFDEIDRIYIAGGFGASLNIGRAIIIGMLPDLPEERFTFLGNTSVAGAYLCLLSEDMRREAEEIARRMTYVELSVSRRFMDEYMSALFLPHTDMRQFPTVERIMTR